MDWKDLLAKKVEEGALEREEFSESAQEISCAPKPLLHVVIDRKGRKGKTATIIEGFDSNDAEVSSIAATLKSRLGVGGSSRGGEILIQGDFAERVKTMLKEMGYKVK